MKSKRAMVAGLSLAAILVIIGLVLQFGLGYDFAKAGQFASGWFSAGNFSIGVFSIGIFSIGAFSLGIFSVMGLGMHLTPGRERGWRYKQWIYSGSAIYA